MKGPERKYIITLSVFTVLLILIKVLQPTTTDWSESYSAIEKKPFGAFILNELLPTSFSNGAVLLNNAPIFTSELSEYSTNWIFINQNFGLDGFEYEILVEKVDAGDHVFISARQFYGAFADSLNIQVSQSFPFIDPDATSLDSLLSNTVNFNNSSIRKTGGWEFPVILIQNYFTQFDTLNTEILGLTDGEDVNFIKVKLGSGAFYIHTSPYLFTNYYLKNMNRYDYAFKALSYLPNQTTYWDEYYKIERLSSSSPMRYIVSNKNLRLAWFLGIFGFIAYLVFNSRRTQRIIPVITAPVNSSIIFAETIANLYINHGTHKDILDKKVAFLLDYIRTNLGLTTSVHNDEFFKAVANRSGIEQTEIDELFRLIQLVKNEIRISETELKRITQRIDRFYKQSQR